MPMVGGHHQGMPLPLSPPCAGVDGWEHRLGTGGGRTHLEQSRTGTNVQVLWVHEASASASAWVMGKGGSSIWGGRCSVDPCRCSLKEPGCSWLWRGEEAWGSRESGAWFCNCPCRSRWGSTSAKVGMTFGLVLLKPLEWVVFHFEVVLEECSRAGRRNGPAMQTRLAHLEMVSKVDRQ